MMYTETIKTKITIKKSQVQYPYDRRYKSHSEEIL